jgi:hypothetical protein
MLNIFLIIILIGGIGFCIYMYYRYITLKSYDPKIDEIKKNLQHVYHSYTRDNKNIDDIISIQPSNKSYTINKSKMYLCLKDKNGNYYNTNMLMYVALHELAHVLCDEIGHTDKFHNIFNNLLDIANSLGYYSYSIPITMNYCNY